MISAPLEGWRHVKVIDRRTAIFRAPDQMDFQVMSAVRSLALTDWNNKVLLNFSDLVPAQYGL